MSDNPITLDSPEDLQLTAPRSYDEIVMTPFELPPGEIISEAWELVKPNIWILIAGALVLGIAQSVAQQVFVGIVINGPLAAGMNIAALLLITHRELKFDYFFVGFKRFLPLFLLYMVSGLFIVLGCFLLILPGLYLAIAFVWATYLVIDRQEDFWPAMMNSMKVVNSSFGTTFVLLLALAGLNILGMLACGVGVLVTGPISIVTLGVAYKRIFGITGGVNELTA